MNKIKKINLLFCLIFSFIFFFGSVFSVQAGGVVQDSKVMKQCIDQNEYPNEIVECVVNYTTQDIRNHGEKKIIWNVDNVEFRMERKAWYRSKSDYIFGPSNFEISSDRKTAKIFVTVSRDGFGFWNGIEEFNLTFELNVN